MELGVCGNENEGLYSINNQSQDNSEIGEEMDIESQRPYPTSTFFSNESGLSKEPTYASTGSGVAAFNPPKVKVSVAAPSHYPA